MTITCQFNTNSYTA